MPTPFVPNKAFGKLHRQGDFSNDLGLEPHPQLQNPLELFIRIGAPVLVAWSMGRKVVRYFVLSAVCVRQDVIRCPPRTRTDLASTDMATAAGLAVDLLPLSWRERTS